MAINDKGEYVWDIPPVDAPLLCPAEQTIPGSMNFYCPRYTVNRLYGTRSFLPDGERGAYEWYSYADVVRAVAELATGMAGLGLVPGDKLGIFAASRAEWMMADWAAQACGLIVCPLYDVLALDELEANVRSAEVDTLFVSLNTLPALLGLVERGVTFSNVILMDDRQDDRAFVVRSLPDLAPTWVSTTPKSDEVMDRLHAIWEKAYLAAGCAAADPKTGPIPDIGPIDAVPEALEADQSTDRTPEELSADPLCGRYRPYAPPPHVVPPVVRGLTDKRTAGDVLDSAVALVTTTFSGLREAGRRDTERLPPSALDLSAVPKVPEPEGVKPDTICSFVFTSGSTGTPKAAMVTHLGLLESAMCLSTRGDVVPTGQLWPRNPHDYFISYLPTAHVFARALAVRSLHACEHVGFYRGSVGELFDDIATLRPTIMPCVPRILQRVYDGVMAAVAEKPWPLRTLFHRQLARRTRRFYGMDDFAGAANEAETFLDTRILGVVKQKFGGRVRLMYSGSAPLPKELGRFFQTTVTPNLIEGYASSETSSGGAVQYQGTRTMGHIGAPLGNFEMKLVPVPELGYSPKDDPDCPIGELCVRGNNVFKGYYKAPEATDEVLDSDGWFHTGDICKFVLKPGPAVGTASGPAAGPYIQIIDRKKSVMKLSQGEFVATENVQGAINAARYAGQVFVGGSSEEPYVLAVVVPDEATFVAAARKLIEPGAEGDVTPEVVARYCRDPRAIAMVHKEIVAEARKIGLKGYEVPKAVLLEPEAWSVENGLATPSMKLRSPLLKRKYMPSLLKAYEALHEAGADTGRAFEPMYAAAAEAVCSIIENK